MVIENEKKWMEVMKWWVFNAFALKIDVKKEDGGEGKWVHTINLNRPINGSKKSPTCTVPAEHSNAKQQADDI